MNLLCRWFRIFAPGAPANVDQRLGNNSEDQLVDSLRSLQLGDTDLPLRPDFGTVGQAIKLRTNFFPVRIPKNPLYEYEVKIKPEPTGMSSFPFSAV